MARFNMTYHGSPSAQSIMSQGFRPGGIMSVAPGQVFSSPSYGFASGYGRPVGMVTPTSALSIPSANFSTGTIGSEVIQNPKTATRGMNLANKLGTIYTSPRAQSLMEGKTVSGLGGSTPGNFLKALGIMGSLPAQAALMTLSPTRANADEINMGPEDFANLAAAETASNIQGLDLNDYEQSITANEPMDIEGFLGTSTPQDLGFIGMAPGIKEAVGITDRNRGQSYFDPVTRTEVAAPNAQGRPSMADIAGEINENLRDLGNPLGDSRVVSEEQGLSGFPGLGQVDRGFQDVLDAREARRNEIAMQQNPDYGQFFDAPAVNEPKRGIASIFGKMLGPALTLAGFPTPGKLVSAYNTVRSLQDGALGNVASRAKTGIGSLGSRIAGKMRGINPNTGRANTQAEYESNRANRSLAKRQANMIARKNAGKTYSAKNLAEVTKELNRQNTAKEKAKTQKSQNPNLRSGADNGGGRSKIVCTMMNDRYGFGSFRNKIWMKFHESYGPEYQKGYHAIFLPLVKIAKGEGKINTAVRKVLEHMGRHVTADMFKIMKGKKRDTLGRIYRAIFEPACHIIGKIKSALGRG